MTILRTALIQQQCDPCPYSNLTKSCEMIRHAASGGAKLIVLQELHTTFYFCQIEDPALFDLAEPIPGASTDTLGKLAAELGVVIIASIFERRATGLYHNSAVVIDTDGAIAGKYRKMHIPDDPGFYEKFYFTPGDTGFTPIRTSVGNLGVMICWDQWYPEAARLMTLAGADILIYPTAIGWSPPESAEEQERQLEAWITVQRGHAIANSLPLLAVNRVGYEASAEGSQNGIKFWGSSFAAGPQGEILALASRENEEILFVDLDMAKSETVRRIWPFLRDRRIDEYGDLVKRFRD